MDQKEEYQSGTVDAILKELDELHLAGGKSGLRDVLLRLQNSVITVRHREIIAKIEKEAQELRFDEDDADARILGRTIRHLAHCQRICAARELNKIRVVGEDELERQSRINRVRRALH